MLLTPLEDLNPGDAAKLQGPQSVLWLAGLGSSPAGPTCTGTLPSSRNVWLALYPANFCFQTQLHLPAEIHTASFLLSSDITYGCSFLSAVVGRKSLFLALSKISWQCSQAGWSIWVTDFFHLQLQDTPQSPLGCVRLGWSTSSEAAPQMHPVQSAPDCAVLRNMSLA